MAKKAISEDLISSADAAKILKVGLRRLQVLANPSANGSPARLPPALWVGRVMVFRRADVLAFERSGQRSLPPGRPKQGKKGGAAT